MKGDSHFNPNVVPILSKEELEDEFRLINDILYAPEGYKRFGANSFRSEFRPGYVLTIAHIRPGWSWFITNINDKILKQGHEWTFSGAEFYAVINFRLHLSDYVNNAAYVSGFTGPIQFRNRTSDFSVTGGVSIWTPSEEAVEKFSLCPYAENSDERKWWMCGWDDYRQNALDHD